MMFDIASADRLQSIAAHVGAVWDICGSPDNVLQFIFQLIML